MEVHGKWLVLSISLVSLVFIGALIIWSIEPDLPDVNVHVVKDKNDNTSIIVTLIEKEVPIVVRQTESKLQGCQCRVLTKIMDEGANNASINYDTLGDFSFDFKVRGFANNDTLTIALFATSRILTFPRDQRSSKKFTVEINLYTKSGGVGVQVMNSSRHVIAKGTTNLDNCSFETNEWRSFTLNINSIRHVVEITETTSDTRLVQWKWIPTDDRHSISVMGFGKQVHSGSLDLATSCSYQELSRDQIKGRGGIIREAKNCDGSKATTEFYCNNMG